MTETERQFDLALAECEAENRLLRARNERLENRQWIGLTDAEAQWLYENCRTPSNFIEMVEAKLKEKNT